MKLGNPNDEIKFDANYGTVARYVVTLDGVPTLAIQCDTADKDRVIKVLDADGTRCLTTKGRWSLKTKLTEDADGLPLGTETYVDRKSVYGYVLPRLHVLLGRLLRTPVECANCGTDAP
jgi:hypothetical protein